jgi:Ca2+-binding EF-hand superfamily protein
MKIDVMESAASSSSTASPVVDPAVPATGRQLANERDLQVAFDFLDPEGRGLITVKTLRQTLLPFYESITAKECKRLMNGKPTMTVDELRNLLTGDVIGSFDPTREAFKEVYDPDGLGFIEVNKMRKIFTEICGVSISSEDIEVLIRTADHDGDGRIGIDDFRQLLSYTEGQ